MIDIFSALLGIASICVMFRAVSNVIFRPAKIWDEEDRIPEEIEELIDFDKIRHQNPHIWIQ